LGDTLSAIEYMDQDSVQFSLNYSGQNHPFQDGEYDHYLLIEMSGFDSSEEAEGLLYDQMIDLFEKLEGCYEDAIICENHT